MSENNSESGRSPIGPKPQRSKLIHSSTMEDCGERFETEHQVPVRSNSGDFEELVEQRLIKRRNSLKVKSLQKLEKGPVRPSAALFQAPSIFLALIGDKEISDPEEITESDEDATTKESNPETTSTEGPVILEDEQPPTPSFFEDLD